MQTLCDVNVLLALVYARHAHHRQSLAWVDSQANQEIVLCRVTQVALLRLLSNSTVMQERVCTHREAWRLWDLLSSDGRFLFMQEPANIEQILRVYTDVDIPSPKLWQDAYLAAFSRSTGIGLVTFDRGFQRFQGLQLTLLP